MNIHNLGKTLGTRFELLLILLDALLGLVIAIHFTNLLIIVIKVTYCLVGLFVPGLCIALGNGFIHCGKLLLISGNILLGHCHNALVVLFNHVHIGIELGTIDALYLETVHITLFEELSRHRLFYCDCSIAELITLIIVSAFNNLHNRQVLEFRHLSLAQAIGSIGKICFKST